MMIALALIASATVTDQAIAPPLHIVLHQTSEQTRDDGRTERTYRIERDIVFAADGDGYAATVTLISAAAVAAPAERRRYTAANAPLLHRPVVIRLDRTGNVRGIDELESISRDWIEGLAAMVPANRSADSANALRDRLRALSPERRAAMIGSMASALFAPVYERTPAPARPASLTSPAPFSDVPLTGTTTLVDEGGAVRLHTVAEGRSAGTAPLPGAAVSVVVDRLTDPASGLILSDTTRESMVGRGIKLSTITHSTLTR